MLVAALRVLRLDARGHHGRGQAGARRRALPARAPHDGPAGAHAGAAAARRRARQRRRVRVVLPLSSKTFNPKQIQKLARGLYNE